MVNEGNEVELPRGEPTPVHRFLRHGRWGNDRIMPMGGANYRGEMTTKDTKSTKESENEAFDAVSQFGDVEIDQQANLHAGQLHLGQ